MLKNPAVISEWQLHSALCKVSSLSIWLSLYVMHELTELPNGLAESCRLNRPTDAILAMINHSATLWKVEPVKPLCWSAHLPTEVQRVKSFFCTMY